MTRIDKGKLLDTICVVGINQDLLVQQLRNRGCEVVYYEDQSTSDFMTFISKTEFELIIFCDDIMPAYAIEYAKRWGRTLYIGDKSMFARLACCHYTPKFSMDMGDDIIRNHIFTRNIDHIIEASMTHDYKLNFLSYFIEQDDKTLYDVSAGRGVYLRYWREKGFSVCGSEYNNKNIKYMENHGITTWAVDLNAKGMKLPLVNNGIDVVTCTEVLEHVERPKDVVWEMMRVAKKTVLITTPVGNSYSAPDHINHWDSEDELRKGILPGCCRDARVDIYQIVSKPEDWLLEQRAFVVRIKCD